MLGSYLILYLVPCFVIYTVIFDDYSLIGTSTFSEDKTFYLHHHLKTAYDSVF